MRNLLVLLGLAVGAQSAVADDDFTFHAYYRTGMNYSEGGSEGVCFEGPGWPHARGRLGNECFSYIEYFLQKKVQPHPDDPDAVWFRGSLGMHMVLDGNDTAEEVNSDSLTFGNREVVVEAVNFAGMKGAVAWIGKRFYRRLYIPMWDFFVLENQGLGFGVYDMPLGSQKMAMAVFRNHDQASDAPHFSNVDLRLSEIPIGSHSLEVLAIYGAYSKANRKTGTNSYRPLSGLQLGAVIRSPLAHGAKSQLFIQYGMGVFGGRPEQWPGKATGSTLNRFNAPAVVDDPATKDIAQAIEKSSTLQWAHNFSLPTSQKDWHHDIAYAITHVDFGGRKNSAGQAIKNRTTYAAGLRSAYFLNQHVGLEADLYTSLIKNGTPHTDFADNSDDTKPIDRQLNKLTLASIYRLEPIYDAMPQLRLFGTYAMWNDEQKGDRYVTGDSSVYAGETAGFTVGVQGEVWW